MKEFEELVAEIEVNEKILEKKNAANTVSKKPKAKRTR